MSIVSAPMDKSMTRVTATITAVAPLSSCRMNGRFIIPCLSLFLSHHRLPGERDRCPQPKNAWGEKIVRIRDGNRQGVGSGQSSPGYGDGYRGGIDPCPRQIVGHNGSNLSGSRLRSHLD